METENPILPSEGFASFHNATTINTTTHANSNSNNNNANTISNRPKSVSPRLSKIIHAYEVRPPAAAGERNSPGDASKHSNTIQSQGSNSSRNNNAPFVSRSPTTATTTTTGGVNVLLESQRGVTAASSATATILPSTPTTTTFPSIASTLLPVTYTTIIPSSKKTISKPISLNSNSRNNSSQDLKAVPVSLPRPIKAGLSVSVPMPVNNNTQMPAIAAMCVGPCKPLWQHTRTNAEQIRTLGLTNQEIQKQEKIFELIYTESEYLDDLKNMHKLFVEELNVKMAEARRKKRSSPDKADVKLYERLARLLSHIKDLWNGHQSLLRSLQNKQESESPVVEDIGSVFESFYMFTIYDSYFAQYTTSSRDFQLISSGNSELCLIIRVRNLLKTPVCKSLSMEGIFLKPIQRLQKYPLFFKDLMNMTPKDDPDYAQLEHALGNHQRGLTKIDDRIWVEEHNEMLKDLQQRIKGLPSNFSLVEKHRYLILDGPVYRVATRQPSKFSFGKHSSFKSEGHGTPISSSMEWRDRFKTPGMNLDTAGDDAAPILIHRPSQLDYHHQHAKPAFSPTPPSSLASSASSSQSGLGSPTVLSSPFPSGKSFTPRAKSYIDPQHHDSGFNKSTFLYQSPSSPPSATTLHSLSSVPSPIPIPNSPPKQQHQPPSVSQLVSHYNFNLSSSFSNFASIGGAGHPRNTSSSALHLPGMIKNSTDVEAEYHVFVFTDIVLWTKRVMSRYHRKEGVPWNFKLIEPVSRLTSVCNTSEDNVFMCTSVNTSSTSYMVRTEDETAARMWRTTVPTLVPFHCSRNLRDRSKK
ncbi:MAG: hypothetical protein J3R72DRAFT_40684 [Linnemannia gamsii]|nr:MAG: hypothetical protein J3R72DRAFT_40684 [Linnemannia gamsii]